MLKKFKIIPIVIIIFVLSTLTLIVMENAAKGLDLRVSVLRATKDISPGEPLDEKNVKVETLNKEWLSGIEYYSTMKSIKDKYAKDYILKGDFIRGERVGNKNQIVKKEVAPGYERISVNITKLYNAVNYSFTVGDNVSLDCAINGNLATFLKTKYTKNILKQDSYRKSASTEENSQYDNDSNSIAIVRVLESAKIVSIHNKEGVSVSDEEREKNSNKNIESVTFDVSKEDAYIIQLLRNSKGVFEVTKLPKED